MMKTRAVLLASLALTLLGLAWLSAGVQAAPSLQTAYASPTPGPDGRIIYIVKSGDTCTSIALLNNVSLEYLTVTNLLDPECTLREGQTLLIGIGGPGAASPTPGPSPTPTFAPPTPTPIAGGMAEVCVLVYDDVNGDALRQETERAVPGAALSLTSQDGTFSQTLVSAVNPIAEEYQGMCFSGVPMGEYNISAAPPPGFNPTMHMTTSLTVVPGDTAYIDFGAQSQEAASGSGGEDGPSPLLGVLGAVFLLAGIGMGVYVWRTLGRKK
jgi:hypothetical protein